MSKIQVKNRRTRACNEQQSSEISKVKDMRLTIESIGNISKVKNMLCATIKWNIKRQGYAINHDQVKCQRSGICN